MTELHCLYRFFDTGGALLYVGITCDPSRRWPKHVKTKPWWSQVAKITLETHPSRDAVLAAERAAIASERPRYNIVGNQTAPTGIRRPFPVGFVVAVALHSEPLPLVGLIEKAHQHRAWLRHVDWMIGFFVGELCEFRYDDVLCSQFARKIDMETKIADGFRPEQTVYDLDPLSAFQDKWDRRPPR